MIGDLADNGGQTDTHGLLEDGPAIEPRGPSTARRPTSASSRGRSPARARSVRSRASRDRLHCHRDSRQRERHLLRRPRELHVARALNEASPADAVILPAGTYVVDESALPVEGDTIVGAGARTTIIEGDSGDRVLNVTQGANEVAGVTITGGESPGSPMTGIGGGILVNGATTSLLMSNVTVTENQAFEGGGIGTNGGTLTVLHSTISDNNAGAPTSGGAGGGLWLGGTTTR